MTIHLHQRPQVMTVPATITVGPVKARFSAEEFDGLAHCEFSVDGLAIGGELMETDNDTLAQVQERATYYLIQAIEDGRLVVVKP